MNTVRVRVGHGVSAVRSVRLPDRLEFERRLTEVMELNHRGSLLLVEVSPSSPLPVEWAGQHLASLVGEPWQLHRLGEVLFGVLLPARGPAETWLFAERLVSRLSRISAHVRLAIGRASWPLNGLTTTDIVAEAVASLCDGRSPGHEAHDEDLETLLEHEGERLEWLGAGELLSG
jgi:hypothetical protein